MNPSDYVTNAAKTDHKDYTPVIERISNEETAKLMHYLLGMCTETGELQDAMKKFIAYGKPLDKINIKEELGDVLWYMARICGELNFTFEDIMEVNINKLKARYGDKFTEDAALNRDLTKERKVLETKE